MARVALLQCELEHRHQAPHLAGSLYSADLRADGHAVRRLLVHPRGLEAAAREMSHWDAQLLACDSVFPFGMLRRLHAATGAALLVGGHNALQHALRGPCDVAVVGPGRRAMREAARAVEEGLGWEGVGGAWWRRPVRRGEAADGDGRVLDARPQRMGVEPGGELGPFRPDHEWEYFGPPRAAGADLHVPSVVAAMGCPWNRSALGDAAGNAGLSAEPAWAGVRARMPDVAMSAAARSAVARDFVRREGGCTFCVLRYTPRRGATSVRAVVDALLPQVRAWAGLGARGVSVQSEDPLPFLPSFLDRLREEGLAARLDEIHARTIPWIVLRREPDLRRAVDAARRAGLRLVLGQVGFEAFDERSLDLYHKGLKSQENLAAAGLLAEIEAGSGGTFVGTRGHGFVPLHPWTRPADLAENLAAARRSAPWMLHGLHPSRRIEIYGEWTPLFWKAQDDGLLEPAPGGFGWGWRFQDAGTGEIVAVAGALLAAAAGAGAFRGGEEPPDAGARALEAALDCFRGERDPAARRRRVLALREAWAGGSAGRAGV